MLRYCCQWINGRRTIGDVAAKCDRSASPLCFADQAIEKGALAGADAPNDADQAPYLSASPHVAAPTSGDLTADIRQAEWQPVLLRVCILRLVRRCTHELGVIRFMLEHLHYCSSILFHRSFMLKIGIYLDRKFGLLVDVELGRPLLGLTLALSR